jgi:FKBP-type peptidyl-prolyl cis-trans isomerase
MKEKAFFFGVLFSLLLCTLQPGWVGALDTPTSPEAGGTPSPTPTPSPAPEGPAVAKQAEPPVVQTASGLRYQDLEVGKGVEAYPGAWVEVHYVGYLPNGDEFDSTLARRRPFGFQLGVGKVIAGWDEGVVGMRVGGRRKLIIPPHLAYGERGVPGVIPPNSELTFEVLLLKVN